MAHQKYRPTVPYSSLPLHRTISLQAWKVGFGTESRREISPGLSQDSHEPKTDNNLNQIELQAGKLWVS